LTLQLTAVLLDPCTDAANCCVFPSKIVAVEGETESVTGGAAPVPDSGSVCGLPLALSVNVRAPVRAPMAVGVKVMEKVQLVPALSAVLVEQVVACEKSPLMAMVERLKSAVPLFSKVTVCAALEVPVLCELKVSVVGLRLTPGTDGTVGGALEPPPPPPHALRSKLAAAVATHNRRRPECRRDRPAKYGRQTGATADSDIVMVRPPCDPQCA